MSRHDPNLDAHVYEAFAENVAFFRSLDICDEMIARRLGVSLDTMQTRLRRVEAHGQRDSHPAA